MPRPNRRASKEEMKASVGSLGRLFKILFTTYPIQLIAVVVLIIISVFANVQGTLFIQHLVDDYIVPMVKNHSRDFGPLAAAMLKVVRFYVIGIVATYTYNLIMVYVGQGMLRKMRGAMFEHMEKLPIRYFDTHAHGDIMSTYTNDIDTLRQMVGQSIPQIINSAMTIIMVFISMITLSIPLTIVTLLMVGVMLVVTANLAKLSGKYFMQQQKDIAAVNGNIEEMMNGQKVVKVFNHEEQAIEKFTELNEQLFDSASKANSYANIMMPANAQIGNVSYVIVAVVGGALALSGATGLTLGKLVSFLTFNKSFNMPINQVSQQFNFIIMAMAGASRIFALLDEEPEVDDGYVMLVNAKEENGQLTETKEHTGLWAWKHYHAAEGTTTYQKLTGKITFDDVDFSYNPDKQILHNITLFGNPGEKIAFVGATGAGKTTIMNLINRFYDIEDGKIRYDDINVNKIKKADLRRSLGIVLQDTHLFTGTVAENIRYGKLDATDEEVIAAAKLANADGFIRKLPQGYDTKLTGDGANLSQGQRQLLAIARAAIADPPALILDEATSSIDTRTEKIVQDGMDKLMHGRTTFVIAHRLSTIRNSDCIMVMENGRIIERGNHDELIAEGGKYYQLYTGKIVNA
ncbi:MAG: ABC transporter ATP-binding protein [Lachnospiraceae bacterium]|nr:ABC transporter ATP-binding protein [Lachnospiraceae bacterium]MBQ1721425.1 ABC transporter ATP-binding protein [Lachnospiraceae bacterium]MBQ2504306.1 ABC transporter ATP-binding protein [Lachnospiraceae bacterium]